MDAAIIEIVTDGACSGNPGPGGWAVLIGRAGRWEEHAGAEPATTNNCMELRAAIEGLRRVPPDARVRLSSDSQYLLHGITRWITGWRARDWRTASGSPVEHRELWQELDLLAAERVEWRYVRGHAGHPLNERADALAQAQARRLGATLPPTRPAPGRPAPAGTSYLSLVGGRLARHASWDACRTRVHGVSGARFRKCQSRDEERATVRAWGLGEAVLARLDDAAATPHEGA